MAVTSAMSSEFNAVSSIWMYDIYKAYINPEATDKTLVPVGHYCIVVYAFLMTGFSTILSFAGISMGYLYLVMGVLVSSAVIPITLTLTWKHMNWKAAAFSPILGFIVSVSSWLGTAKREFEVLTVASTGANNPVLVGNLAALLSPVLFVLVLSAFKPDNYDFNAMRPSELDATGPSSLRRGEEDEARNQLAEASRIAKYVILAITLAFLVLWPMPMYGTGYIFSLNFFTGWIVVGILWIFISFLGSDLFESWIY